MDENFEWGLQDLIITEKMEAEYDEFFTKHVLPRVKGRENVKENNGCAWLVTINPKVNPSLPLFKSKILKGVSKSWITTYYYCIEQRGEMLKDAGNGLHCHMLLLCDTHKRKSQVIREFYSTFQSLLDSKASVDVRFVKTEFIDDKIDYVCGKKFDKTKHKKMLIDNYFRKKNNLQPYYTTVKKDAGQEETRPGPRPEGGGEQAPPG